MRGRKHYPPIAVFHAPDCLGLGGNGTALPVDLAREDYPHHRQCPCIAANFGITPFVVVERGEDSDHLYRPSDEKPADAARSLCRACKGTHGDVDQEPERIEVKPVPTKPEQVAEHEI